MKLAIVLLLALVSPALADPKLRAQLDALGTRITALEKIDYKVDKQAKGTIEQLHLELGAFGDKLKAAHKAALPRQARIKELDEEIANATIAIEEAQTDADRKAAEARLKALQTEHGKLTAELARAPAKQRQADLEREKAFGELARTHTKLRFAFLSEQRRMLEAKSGTSK
jgi:uncharacterized protein involved in exopolysaccharide biosynthesis